MNVFLRLQDGVFESLRTHLLPRGNLLEQAAFLFATPSSLKDGLYFDVIEVDKLQACDFEIQGRSRLDLCDVARARVIKKAHELQASLIEVHSHPGSLSAAFSPFDLTGLRDTVPNIWWRLKKKPYIAVVVAEHGFDALVWLESPENARLLTALIAGTHMQQPTNASLRYW